MSRRRAAQYLHLEAESESEDYESSDFSEDLDNIEPIVQSKTKSFSQQTRELEDRYKDSYEPQYRIADEYDTIEKPETIEVPSQSQLLPTARSPLLFLVRCKVGKEKDICYKIFERVKEKEICSVVQKEGLKGYVYVEAYKKQAVEDVLAAMRNVVRRRFSIVPFKEMIEAVSYNKNIIISEFARIKSGKYKGDLVQILENFEDVVKVKVIPRIDDLKRRFDPEEHRTEVVKKDGGYYYNRDFYKDGYLEKIMLKSNLDFEVDPTFAELSDLNVKGFFGINDTVKVVRGDLKNLVGTVENLSGNSIFIKKDRKSYEVNINDIEKHFEIGQEVSYRGENGVVLKIMDKKAILGMDNFTREAECFINDVKPPVPEKREVPVAPVRFRSRRDPLVNKYVVIRQGPYKGLHGLVKDSHQDKFTVQLRSNFKIVVVDRSAIVSREMLQSEEPAVEEDETFGGKTPSFKTPGFKTPSYRTPSFKTPSTKSLNSSLAEEAGTDWLVSPYDGVGIYSGGKMYTLSDVEGGIYKTKTGETFFLHEIKYVEPEKYDRVMVMDGDYKSNEGILASINGPEGDVRLKSGKNVLIDIDKLAKKVE